MLLPRFSLLPFLHLILHPLSLSLSYRPLSQLLVLPNPSPQPPLLTSPPPISGVLQLPLGGFGLPLASADAATEGRSMECNKDEAVRSKQIAEAKFVQHDLSGAKKFALKARQLFPDLEGLPQLIAVLDVHSIAQEKINGVESNWYGVLQVDPTADEATIRKQYRKLALLLHPDKNKAIGAEAAFKIISEAWGVLSDKTKKAMHDMRRNGNTSQSSRVTQSKGPPTPNGLHNFSRPAATSHPTQPAPQRQPRTKPHSKPRAQAQAQARAQAQPPLQPQVPPNQAHAQASGNSATFWTACPYCKMQYEYLRIYENRNLGCPTCSKPFAAREVQVIGVNAWWPPPYQQGFGGNGASTHPHVNNEFANGNPIPNGSFSWGSFRKDGTTQGVHETYDKARGERVEVQEARRKEQREKEQQKKKEQKAKEVEKAKDAFSKLMERGKVASEQEAASQCKMASGQEVESEKSSVKLTPEKLVNISKSQSGKNDEMGHAAKVGEVKDAVERIPSGELDGSGDADSKLTPRRSLRCKRNTSDTFTNEDESQLDFSPSKKTRADVHIPGSAKELHDSMDGVDNSSNIKEFMIHPELSTVGGNEMGKKCEFKVVEIEDGGNLMKKGITATAARELDVGKSLGDCIGHDAALTSKLVKDSTRQLEASELNSSKIEIECSKAPSAVDVDAMNVPDPDFYDFDRDRTESHFAVGQIWAVYDDDDGMPRYYARINKVLSFQPFKVQMSWLEPRSPSREIVAWLESGFSYTCGEYKLGKGTTNEYVNTFSHLVRFEKGQRGAIKIYPRKGDIWALYKEWNTVMEVDGGKHDYEMVEVLADYREEVGVNIVFLVKIQGFKTLFQRDVGVQALIPSKELLRFSHQVPAHRLSSEEVLGVPEGCWELDPASTPLELIMGRSKK